MHGNYQVHVCCLSQSVSIEMSNLLDQERQKCAFPLRGIGVNSVQPPRFLIQTELVRQETVKNTHTVSIDLHYGSRAAVWEMIPLHA